MKKYVELENWQVMEAADGDLLVPPKLTPDKVDSKNVTTTTVFHEPPYGGTPNWPKKLRFANTGYKVSLDFWPSGKSIGSIWNTVRIQSNTRCKIRVYRVYAPRVLPGNAHYSKPLPIP